MPSRLEAPEVVVAYLTRARALLGDAHLAATESEECDEGVLTNLTGEVRDMLFGLGTMIDSLIGMIEDGRYG